MLLVLLREKRFLKKIIPKIRTLFGIFQNDFYRLYTR